MGQQQFNALPIRIGRNPLNDCKLGLNFISEFHACIEEVDGRISVRDLGSTNGVYVRSPDGQVTRITPQTPVDLGHCHYQFLVGRLGIRVEIQEAARAEETWHRKLSGSVLGNRSMLEGNPPEPFGAARGSGYAQPGAAQPSPLPPPGALAPLPPLSGAVPPGQYGLPIAGPAAPGNYGPPLTGPAQPPNFGTPGGYPAAPEPAPRVGMSTQHLGMRLEVLALIGLRELASSLVPGPTLETTGDVARLITKLHDAIEVFCRCFIPLREGYSQFISSMDLRNAASQRSMHRSNGYRQVEGARTASDVATALLNFRDPSLDAPAAVEGIFADLMIHQVALLDGVMRGVKALLEELSPENIERTAPAERRTLGLPLGGRHKALWETYCERYAELSEESETFARILGAEFAEAYREYTRRRPPE
jgi:type VI secretion system protein ImpI